MWSFPANLISPFQAVGSSPSRDLSFHAINLLDASSFKFLDLVVKFVASYHLLMVDVDAGDLGVMSGFAKALFEDCLKEVSIIVKNGFL